MSRIFTSLSNPEVVSLLNQGAVGVIPTDTVYGLVAKAELRPAIERLYSLKRRELAPGTMIGASLEQFSSIGLDVSKVGEINEIRSGSLSVVVDATAVDPYLKQNRVTLPIRIPNVGSLIQLLSQTGALMTTSANAPHEPTSTSIQMAIDYFGDAVDFYVDGGDLSGRSPSTIVGFDAKGEIIVYRQGSAELTADMLSNLQQKTKV